VQAKTLNKTEIIRLAKLGHELQLENILLKEELREAQDQKDLEITTNKWLRKQIEQAEAREQGLRTALKEIADTQNDRSGVICRIIAREALGQEEKISKSYIEKLTNTVFFNNLINKFNKVI
jgi:hypothetical protein